MNQATLYLIDGSGYIFRAYYGMTGDRAQRLTAPDGTPTNAVYVFNQMLVRLLRDIRQNRHEGDEVFLGIAFDLEKPTFRHKIYDEYKAHRAPAPDDLLPQIGLIHELVSAWDIPVLIDDGYEADDLLATMARVGRERGYAVTVISADKDLMQLVSPEVRMWDPMRDVRYDREAVKAKLGVYPEQVVDFLALVGDAVDNVPGVPKIGKKTAIDLLTEFGTLEALLASLDKVKKPSIRAALTEHVASAKLSKTLVTLCDQVPMSFDEAKLRYTAPRREQLEPLFKRLAFSLQTLEATLMRGGDKPGASAAEVAAATPSAASKIEPKTEADAEVAATAHDDAVSRERYRTVATLEALEALAREMARQKRYALAVQTTAGDAMRAELVGLAIATAPGESAYVPLAHRYLGAPKQLGLDEVKRVLGPVFSDPQIAVVGHDLKRDYHVLRGQGFALANLADDAVLLSYVLNPSRGSHGLDWLAKEFLHHDNLTAAEVLGAKGGPADMTGVEIALATAYVAERADVALRLVDLLKPKLSERELKLYQNVEMPLLGVLADMEWTGIRVAPEILADFGKDLSQRLRTMAAEIGALAGGEFNINSPKQLAQVLFGKLQLPVIKRTKSGPSTDQDVLEALAEQHPLPAKILEHRQLQKLLSTYVEALPKLILPRTQRLHTTYNQALAATGRLSSSDPNLQNIPIRNDLGRRIRAAFVAAPGHRFISADYSQIELRVLAHLTRDEQLIDAFVHNEDIHARTARLLYNVGKEAVTAEMRRRAKTINFGLLYGLSAFRLAREEGISMAEAKAFIDAYFGAYPRVRGFMDETIAAAKSRGYVETLLGRRRYIPDLNSRNHTQRQAAERIAGNTPVQGSAADLIKLAMLQIGPQLKKEGLGARLLLQVHDELVLEAPETEVEATMATVKRAMERAYELAVPLVVEVSAGADWSLIH